MMLQQFGFTQYESRVYESLISSAVPLDATSVVKQSGVPRSKVYEVLFRLTEKGLVLESTEDKKRLYRALPIESTIDKLKADFEENVQRLRRSKEKQIPLDDRVWTLKDNHSILAVMLEMIDQAQESIVISGWQDDLQAYVKRIEEKQQKGIDVTIHSVGELDSRIDNISVLIPDRQHGSLERSRILIVDDSEVIFAGIEEDKWQAIRTKSRPLVKFFTEFFYHDVALTEITQRHRTTVMADEAVRNVLLKLRY